MTIEKLITALSRYPKDLDLSEITTLLAVERNPNTNRIQSAYIADCRIAGCEPWGRLYHMERETDLAKVAASLLHGLKINKH